PKLKEPRLRARCCGAVLPWFDFTPTKLATTSNAQTTNSHVGPESVCLCPMMYPPYARGKLGKLGRKPHKNPIFAVVIIHLARIPPCHSLREISLFGHLFCLATKPTYCVFCPGP